VDDVVPVAPPGENSLPCTITSERLGEMTKCVIGDSSRSDSHPIPSCYDIASSPPQFPTLQRQGNGLLSHSRIELEDPGWSLIVDVLQFLQHEFERIHSMEGNV
ncbi:hypothetical protein PMAYCL1PPCAC_02279, partial [Pristionchus mayeri]